MGNLQDQRYGGQSCNEILVLPGVVNMSEAAGGESRKGLREKMTGPLSAIGKTPSCCRWCHSDVKGWKLAPQRDHRVARPCLWLLCSLSDGRSCYSR